MTSTLGSATIKALSENKGTIGKSSLVIVTVALEEISSRNIFYCPCVEPIQVTNCNAIQNTTIKCPPKINVMYSLAFGIAPSLLLFFASLATSPKLWRSWTGVHFRHRSTMPPSSIQFCNLLSIFGHALIAPVTWMCFTLADGITMACALAPMPYDVGPGAKYASCSVVPNKSPLHSAAFKHYKSLSQTIGLYLAAVLLFTGFLIYSVSSCFYPLTYYHAKYYRMYQEHEETEFDDEMHRKAQTQAETNIRKFMSKDRKKLQWDRISNVFNFHRDPKNIALYSYLHQCILEEKNESSEGESVDDVDHESHDKSSEAGPAADHSGDVV